MSVAENAWLIVRRPSVVLRPRRYVLVLSHMRSYSSLLCHLLGSHPEIDGYAEMHRSYRRHSDLLRLKAHAFRSLEGDFGGRFVLDKLLHDRYTVSHSLLDSGSVYPIFLVRNPADSVRSILRMGTTIQSVAWYSDPRLVAEYYETRVSHLAEIARTLERPWLFVRSEELVDATRACLDSIASFLGLRTPLDESYSLFKNTGREGWGDYSDVILERRVVRDRPRDDGPELPDGLLVEARRAYDDCCRTLGSFGTSSGRSERPENLVRDELVPGHPPDDTLGEARHL